MEAHLLTLFWYFWWLLTHFSWCFQYLMNHTFDRFKCPFHIGKYTFHMIMMNELLFFYEKYFSCTYTFFWKEIICTCHKYIFSLYLFQYTFISQFFKSGQIYSYGIKRLVFFSFRYKLIFPYFWHPFKNIANSGCIFMVVAVSAERYFAICKPLTAKPKPIFFIRLVPITLFINKRFVNLEMFQQNASKFRIFFQILWKSRCNILVSFPYHFISIYCYFFKKYIPKRENM